MDYKKNYAHKILGNTINDKVSANKNHIEVLEQKQVNIQLQYSLNELQESFKKQNK